VEALDAAEAVREARAIRPEPKVEERADEIDDADLSADKRRAADEAAEERVALSKDDKSSPANKAPDPNSDSDRAREESEKNNSQASQNVVDLALSRSEQDGLRSFQQVSEVSAFDATGGNIDVSV